MFRFLELSELLGPLTFSEVTNRNLTQPIQTAPASKMKRQFNVCEKQELVVAKKNKGGGGKQRIQATRGRGARPGARRPLSRVLKEGAAAWAWRASPLGSGRARPASFPLVGSGCQEGARKPSNPFSFMRPFLGSCRALRLIRPSLVGMLPAREKLGLHFRASSLLSFPHYLFLENGVVLIVFSFSACGRFSPLPHFLDLRSVYFRGWTRKSPSLLDARQRLTRGGK